MRPRKTAAPYIEPYSYPIYDQIVDLIFNHDDPKELAYDANVSITTIHNWMSGKTKKPRIDTLYKVAYALGYEFRIVAIKKASLRRVK